MRLVTFVLVTYVVASAAAASKPDATWPGFRGHDMSGIATANTVPDKWSTTEHVKWVVPISGHGWSSPIVWGDTVFVTSAISSGAFKKPTPGLYGNEYIAEMQSQGVSDDEIGKRAQARDNELTDEANDIRYMVYALDANTGKVRWEREAIKMKPFRGRRSPTASASTSRSA